MTDQITEQLVHPADSAAPSVTGESTTPRQPQPMASAVAVDPAPAIDISAEQPAAWIDLAVVSAVVAVALVYLYVKLWRRRGRCDGCAKGASSPCGVERMADRSGPSRTANVTIPRNSPNHEPR